MQPRGHKGFILLTCGGEIDSQRVDNVGAARAGFNGDEVLSWRFFGPKGVHQSFLDFSSSFPPDQLLLKATKNLN
jgi:hypothetical protein